MDDQVPGYRILQRVGEGGFSVVYRAHQERLDRVVALKVLSVDAVDEATMRRFERECQITGRLTGHPNVVTVLDTGISSSGRPYIAMDYFEQGSLRERLSREGPLPVADVLRVGVKIAGALAATHEAEVLHRDVKPQNILISRYGEPGLADFGVARLVDSSEATHTNAFTPHHAAPEIVNGQPPGVTSDVYSLASTMYQLLSGGPAFKSNTQTGIGPLMQRILNDPPPPIMRSDVPPQVFEVIAQALAKKPEDRFPTAIAFATRLQHLQSELGLPVTEIATSAAVTAPPPSESAPEIDHSGLTGPGFDRIGRAGTGPGTQAPATPPSAHTPPASQAPPSGPVPPSPPAAAPGQFATQYDVPGGPGAPPPTHDFVPGGPPAPPPTRDFVPGGPPAPPPTHDFVPESAPLAFPPVGPLTRQSGQESWNTTPDARPSGPNRPDQNRRNVGIMAGVVIGVVAVAGLGVGGIVVFGDDPKPKPKPTPTNTATPSPPPATGTPPPVPPGVMNAARPRDVRATDKGAIVALRWKLGKQRDNAVVVQKSDGTRQETPTVLPNGSTATTLTVDPTKGYCFTVGVVVAFAKNPGEPAATAWSKPLCIRGAHTQ